MLEIKKKKKKKKREVLDSGFKSKDDGLIDLNVVKCINELENSNCMDKDWYCKADNVQEASMFNVSDNINDIVMTEAWGDHGCSTSSTLNNNVIDITKSHIVIVSATKHDIS